MAISRIAINPKVMMGKPVIKGTRITVELLLRKLSQKFSPEDIIKEYPKLTKGDIKAALQYAASTIQNEKIFTVLKESH